MVTLKQPKQVAVMFKVHVVFVSISVHKLMYYTMVTGVAASKQIAVSDIHAAVCSLELPTMDGKTVRNM